MAELPIGAETIVQVLVALGGDYHGENQEYGKVWCHHCSWSDPFEWPNVETRTMEPHRAWCPVLQAREALRVMGLPMKVWRLDFKATPIDSQGRRGRLQRRSQTILHCYRPLAPEVWRELQDFPEEYRLEVVEHTIEIREVRELY